MFDLCVGHMDFLGHAAMPTAKSVSTGMSQRFLVLLHVPFSMPVLFNLRCKYYLGRFWQYGNKIKID